MDQYRLWFVVELIALTGGDTYKSEGKKIIIIYIGIQPVINGIKGIDFSAAQRSREVGARC